MANRWKHEVKSTMGGVVDFACQVGVSGTAASPMSCSLMMSTEAHATVSGTGPGIVTVTLPKDYAYSRMIAWGADFIIGNRPAVPGVGFGDNFAGANVGAQYTLRRQAFQYASGSALADQTDTKGNVVNSTRGGGATFQVAFNQLQARVTGNVAAGNVLSISGTIVDPVNSAVASGSPVATVTIWAKFRENQRKV